MSGSISIRTAVSAACGFGEQPARSAGMMSDFDLLIRANPDIGILEGRIVAQGQNLRGTAAEEIDATGLTVLPGAIDAHVHFNEPGRTDWEGFATGSRAAARGGTTTVFEMPLNAHPPTLD